MKDIFGKVGETWMGSLGEGYMESFVLFTYFFCKFKIISKILKILKIEKDI